MGDRRTKTMRQKKAREALDAAREIWTVALDEMDAANEEAFLARYPKLASALATIEAAFPYVSDRRALAKAGK